MPATKTNTASDRRGLPAAATARRPDQARQASAGEHRHRRNHEDEMPDAVVERRPLHHRDDERQHGRQRDQEEDRAPVSAVLPRDRRMKVPTDAGDQPGREQHLGQLQREQRRHVSTTAYPAPTPARRRTFPSTAFRRSARSSQRMERIARLDDRPRPHQPHHGVAEHQAGQQHQDDMAKPRRRPRGCQRRGPRP